MAPELHLDPDRLRELAAVAAALADEVAAAAGAPPGSAECRQLHAGAGRAARELAEVATALTRAAAMAGSADHAAARALGTL